MRLEYAVGYCPGFILAAVYRESRFLFFPRLNMRKEAHASVEVGPYNQPGLAFVPQIAQSRRGQTWKVIVGNPGKLMDSDNMFT